MLATADYRSLSCESVGHIPRTQTCFASNYRSSHAGAQVTEEELTGLTPAELERLVSRAVAAGSPSPATLAAGSGTFGRWRGLLSEYASVWQSRYAPRALLPGSCMALARGGGRCGALREATLAEAVVHGGAEGKAVAGGPNATGMLNAAGAVPKHAASLSVATVVTRPPALCIGWQEHWGTQCCGALRRLYVASALVAAAA